MYFKRGSTSKQSKSASCRAAILVKSQNVVTPPRLSTFTLVVSGNVGDLNIYIHHTVTLNSSFPESVLRGNYHKANILGHMSTMYIFDLVCWGHILFNLRQNTNTKQLFQTHKSHLLKKKKKNL